MNSLTRRVILILGLTAVCPALLSGCRESSPDSLPGPKGKATRTAARILCASPGVTEIVFGLGEGKRVVGVSDYSVHPPEARALPRIGGLYNPNRERITMLSPDLVISQGKHESLAHFCRERSIPLINPPLDTLDDLYRAIRLIGGKLAAEQRAEEMIRRLTRELEEVRKRVADRTPPKVFLGLGHTPGDLTGLMTAGPGSFLHEILVIAGGENIFADAVGLYPRISKEALSVRQPDIILEVIPDGISEGNRDLMRSDWRRLPMLPAVRGGRVFYLSEDYMLIPGLRIGKIARRLAGIFHPDVFGEDS